MRWRILIVDDEDDVRAILRASLGEKFEVVEAHDGLDALEKLDRYEPDFVILDIMMPMMDGYETCESIRRHPRFSEVPVLFLTALGGKDHIKKGYSTGANLYLTKPFEPERLMKNIELHFDASRAVARPKRYSFEQIRDLERVGAQPVAPGSGEFDIRQIMVSDPEPVAVAAPAPIAQPSGMEAPRPRVMIVDDDPDIVSIVDATLGASMEVCSAGDGFQAIERLVRYQPEILILDIMLPKLSGFQLCQSLRSNQAFKTLPIVVCSAKCSERDISFAQRVGANDFLAKPFSPSQLVAKVQQFLRQPGFRVKPKNIPIHDIRRQENPEVENAFDGEESGVRKMRLETNELKDFLKDQKKQGAPERKEASKEEEKPGRSFFRFGKKN